METFQCGETKKEPVRESVWESVAQGEKAREGRKERRTEKRSKAGQGRAGQNVLHEGAGWLSRGACLFEGAGLGVEPRIAPHALGQLLGALVATVPVRVDLGQGGGDGEGEGEEGK